MFDPDRKFRRANYTLIALISLQVLYLVGVPLSPAVMSIGNHFSGQHDHLDSLLDAGSAGKVVTQLPDQLIIPDIQLDTEVQRDDSVNATTAVSQGVWLWPAGSTPDKGGNVVLLGQRFSYRHPNGVFYWLKSLQPKADIGLVWDHKLYRYKVVGVDSTGSDDSEPLQPTTIPTLTMITSDPQLWPTGRLVVAAQQETTETTK